MATITGTISRNSELKSSKNGQYVDFSIKTDNGDLKYVNGYAPAIMEMHCRGKLKKGEMIIISGTMSDSVNKDGKVYKDARIYANSIELGSQPIPSPDYSNPWVGFYEKLYTEIMYTEYEGDDVAQKQLSRLNLEMDTRGVGVNDRIAIVNKVKTMYGNR